MNKFKALLLLLAALVIATTRPSDASVENASSFVRYSGLEFLTFDELVSLAQNPIPTGALQTKLQKFWTTPIVSNEAYYRGVKAVPLQHPQLGPTLRIGTWNIEKSFEIENAIAVFSDRERFLSLIDPAKASPHSKIYREAVQQRDALVLADVLVFQEIDIGVKRSHYVNGAKEMAAALNLNYAYAPAYLEIDPAYLGLEKITLEEGGLDQEAMDYYRADPTRYKGLFGSAVLSRYPIKNVIVFPLKNQGYDWYWGEKEKTTFLEKSRRFGAKSIFKSEMHREMKVGGRNFMRVDLHVPGLPNDTLTIIAVHLEIKCLPAVRIAQTQEILGYIKDIDNPVVMAGDFNSAPGDLSPTSVTRTVKRTAKNPTTWFSMAVNKLSPHAVYVNATRTISNVSKNFQNPTARSIPVVAPNPTAELFKSIEEFRFSDGGAFDFRGDKNRSTGEQGGLLANANQRDRIGFKTTFQLKRTLAKVIGKYRLDWFFVRSFLKEPRDENGSYRLAPHFGATLEEMNMALKNPVSDHHPNIVDLPFNEPSL